MKFIANRLLSINNFRYGLIAIFMYSVQCSVAQSNLVLNPSFEKYFDTSSLGIAAFAYHFVYNWSDPNTGSSDLFTPNMNPSFTTPPNHHFGFEYPHSGLCYAGFVLYESTPSTFHEYIQASFRSPLVAGKTYAIESYVSMGFEGNSLCISDLGFYFSDTMVAEVTLGDIINVTPQYENPPSNLISTFNGWQRITGTYTAHGGENYISIGVFKPYNIVHIDTCRTYPDGISYTYLFVDDVAVYDTTQTDTIDICLNDSIQIAGNWQHEQGLYFDTIGGLPIKYYIESRPYSASLTVLTRPFEYGDSTKVSLLQTEGSDSSYEIGLHNYLFVKNDTVIDIPMFNIYGCDSTVRYICGWHIDIGKQLNNRLQWNVYPNPANNILRVNLSSNDPNSYSVSIIDVTGRIVLSHFLDNEIINISALKSGMYFIKLINTKTRSVVGTEKFVKE